MAAAGRALAGGYRSEGRQVCPRAWSEGLTPLTTAPGLGLVGFAVDVHTAQAGTLGRTVALGETGGAEVAVGIDDGTCLAVAAGTADPAAGLVTGSGHVRTVRRGSGAQAVEITRSPA
jgi:cyanophycinase